VTEFIVGLPGSEAHIARFMAEENRAWRDYKEAAKPVEQKYIARLSAAESLRGQGYIPPNNEARIRFAIEADAAWDERVIDLRGLARTRVQHLAAALEALREATRDDVAVTWILDAELGSQPTHARSILAQLPCSVRDLNRYAANREWCDEWEATLRRAVRDGALPQESVVGIVSSWEQQL
jgi:hypothetical protein